MRFYRNKEETKKNLYFEALRLHLSGLHWEYDLKITQNALPIAHFSVSYRIPNLS